MPTTVKTLLSDFTEKRGLPTPAGFYGVTEKSVGQLRSLLRELLSELSERKWSVARIRKTWTSVAGNDQGTLESIFGAGYKGLEANSMWNNSRRMRIYGPLSDQIWQAIQVLPNAGPEYQSWISEGKLWVSPTMVAGETLSAVYASKYYVLDVDGTTNKERVTHDEDTLLIPDIVIMRGLDYLWKKQKGEAGWEDDFNDWISIVARNLVKDGMPTLALSRNNRGPMPGIVIPAGSWNV